MSRAKYYLTDHNLSRIVGAAVLRGTGGQAVPPTTLLDGPAICYGILRGCGDIIRRAHNIMRSYYHIDHGYLKRIDWNKYNNQSGYFRVSRNGLCLQTQKLNPDTTRFKNLNIDLKPYNPNGRNIIVCGLTQNFANNHPYLKLNAKEWEDDTVKYLSSITDRPILIKNKDGTSLDEYLRDPYLVVVHSSNAAMEAIINGIGVLVLGDSICWRLNDIVNKEEWEDVRHGILCNAANNQFTLEELSKPETWELLGVQHV